MFHSPTASIVVAGVGAVGLWLLSKEIRKMRKVTVKEGLKSGGQLVAETLHKNGLSHLFVLSGGHISAVYCAAEALGVTIIDVRHEVTTVFAADAYWRLTGNPGVALVTAGPGLTNTVTAVQNAKMAESAVVVISGATGTVLKGRGSLQDIDHLALMRPLCKWTKACTHVSELVPAINEAFRICQEGVPGPVFVELPVDVTYPMDSVVKSVQDMAPKGNGLVQTAIRTYLNWHLCGIFDLDENPTIPRPIAPRKMKPSAQSVKSVASIIKKSSRPVFVLGSQAMQQQQEVQSLIKAVQRMGLPVYCAGSARGLLGGQNAPKLVFRHGRSKVLKQADVVVLCGAICDFRLQYGNSISWKAKLVTVNKCGSKARMNRLPSIAVIADPGLFVCDLAQEISGPSASQQTWLNQIRNDEDTKDCSISEKGLVDPKTLLNPLQVCIEVNKSLSKDAILVMDGGDFVGTAAYTIEPRSPLSWLDPGVFGTLGVGAGFAMGAAAVRPGSPVWIIYGDGAFGFSLAELDTFVRFKMGIICLIGNDAGWTQILRDQEKVFKASTACTLNHTDYHLVAEGFGAKGFLISKKDQVKQVLSEATQIAATGRPVVINCLIARNDFREGSLSV